MSTQSKLTDTVNCVLRWICCVSAAWGKLAAWWHFCTLMLGFCKKNHHAANFTHTANTQRIGSRLLWVIPTQHDIFITSSKNGTISRLEVSLEAILILDFYTIDWIQWIHRRSFREHSVISTESLLSFRGICLIIINKWPPLSHGLFWFWWIDS